MAQIFVDCPKQYTMFYLATATLMESLQMQIQDTHWIRDSYASRWDSHWTAQRFEWIVFTVNENNKAVHKNKSVPEGSQLKRGSHLEAT